MPNDHIASAQHEFRSYAWYVGDLTSYWTLSGAIQGEPFEGSGLRFVAVPHAGNRNHAPQEVERIGTMVSKLLDSSTSICDCSRK